MTYLDLSHKSNITYLFGDIVIPMLSYEIITKEEKYTKNNAQKNVDYFIRNFRRVLEKTFPKFSLLYGFIPFFLIFPPPFLVFCSQFSLVTGRELSGPDLHRSKLRREGGEGQERNKERNKE